MTNSVLLLLSFIIICCPSNSEILSGILDTTWSKEEWVFLARFCFLSEQGKFSYHITYPRLFNNMSLGLYYDDSHQWPSVYGNEQLSCSAKTSPPYLEPARNQKIVLSLSNSECQGITDTRTGAELIECEAFRQFRSVRERWWYIAVSNCNDNKGVYMNYEVNLTNSEDSSDLFKYHFSADESGILETNITFLLLFVLLSVITVVCAVMLHHKKYLHSTYKLFMTSLFVQVASVFFLTIAYGAYANDGLSRKKYSLSSIGHFLGVVSYVIFVVMIVVLAKGYTVTRGKLRPHTQIVLTVFTLIYTTAILLLYIIEFAVFDPAKVLYIYDFYYGVGLILMPIIGLLWLIYAVFFTLKHYPEKWKFYIPFTIVYGFWFLTLPVIVIASNYLIPKYMKEKVVNGVEMTVTLLAYVCFLVLTLPCCVNKVFPYHVQTNKIGLTDDAPHDTENSRGGSAYRVTNQPADGSTVYTVSRETVTFSNGSQSGTANGIAPNLAALFVVQNSHSSPYTPPQEEPSVFEVSQLVVEVSQSRLASTEAALACEANSPDSVDSGVSHTVVLV